MTPPPALRIHFDAESGMLQLIGRLGVQQLSAALAAFGAHRHQKLRGIDLTGLTQLDISGAMLLQRWADDLPITYANEEQRALLDTMLSVRCALPPGHPPQPLLRNMVITVGRTAASLGEDFIELITFTGKAASLLVRALRHRRHLRLVSVSHSIEQVGIKALPIIGLMAFLIAIVLAYQGVAQLKPYGGEQFTVNLVAISILREMGVLLTAIMVAGRSGSAFTAEIGVMKSREEIDALQVMGFDVFDVLVIPRLIAIIIALPLLTFFADLMGMLGGYIILHSLIDISPTQYITQLHLAAKWNDLLVGLVKAPIFAFFIGIVGCLHGLRVSGSAESVGFETTAAVVKSIFLVLVLDAFFSIFFSMVRL